MAKSQKNDRKGFDNLETLSLQLFASFFPKFYFLELELRTKLFNLIKEKIAADWFSQQITSQAKDSLFEREAALILQRKPKGFYLKDSALFSETSLGFWIEFFNPRIYKLTKGLPILVFSKRPTNIKRKDLYNMLTKVKDFRNQLMHGRIPLLISPDQTIRLIEIINLDKELSLLLKWMDITGWQQFERKGPQIIGEKILSKLKAE